MNPNWLAGGCAALALLGQVINLILNLRLKAALLEMRSEVLKDVAADYQRKDLCEEKFEAVWRAMPAGSKKHA